jgi:hypothetical protein
MTGEAPIAAALKPSVTQNATAGRSEEAGGANVHFMVSLLGGN